MNNNSKNVCYFVKRRKADLIKVFGGKCCLCGFDLFQEALEFHHVNPEEKEFSLTSSTMKNLEAQLLELKKCILVCSNCHRGIHSHYYTVPENWRDFYNDEYANILREKLKLVRQREIFYCTNCGKEITRGSQYCTVCAGLQQRKVERPNREELKNLIRLETFRHIGRLFGVSDNAIRKWCKSMNLPSRKSDIANISDLEWEKI